MSFGDDTLDPTNKNYIEGSTMDWLKGVASRKRLLAVTTIDMGEAYHAGYQNGEVDFARWILQKQGVSVDVKEE